MFLFGGCFFLDFWILRWGNVGAEGLRGSSEALGLLHEAWLGGQRHEGRGQAPQAHPGAKAELGGGQQGLEDADQAEGRAAVGDEVDLVAVGTQEGGDLLQRSGPGNTRKPASVTQTHQ